MKDPKPEGWPKEVGQMVEVNLDPEALKARPKPEAAAVIEANVETETGGVEMSWDGDREAEIVLWVGKPGIIRLVGDPRVLARALMELGYQIARHGQRIGEALAARAAKGEDDAGGDEKGSGRGREGGTGGGGGTDTLH